MRYIPDKTGRFRERPFYEIDELNSMCEQIISSFLVTHRGQVRYPIETDDLTILIEKYVSDLDQFADLSNNEFDVEGLAGAFEPKPTPLNPQCSQKRRFW